VSGNTSYDSHPHSRVIHIGRGEPSEAEIAALTVVLASLAGTAAAEPPEPRSAWADPAHRVRAPVRPGPAAWWGCVLPR
jgi:hypothetical protein